VGRITRALAVMGAVATALFAAGPPASAGGACGSTFQPVASPSAPSGQTLIRAIAANSPTNAWAVGQGGNAAFAMHWNGLTWSAVAVPAVGTGDVLYAVTVAGSHDVWASGAFANSHGKARTLVLHRTTGGWAHVPSPNGGTANNNLYELSAIAPHDVWAAGDTSSGGVDHSLVAHWNGVKWKRVVFPAVGTGDNAVEGLDAVGPNDVWIAIQFVDTTSGRDRAATFHLVGSTWHRVAFAQPTTNDVEPRSLVALGPDSVWMAGFYYHHARSLGLLEHWDGSHWVRFVGVDPTAHVFLEGVAALGPHAVYAFGDDVDTAALHTLVERFDGTSWHRVASADPTTSTDNQLNAGAAIAGPSQQRVWGVGVAEPGGGAEQSLVEQACP